MGIPNVPLYGEDLGSAILDAEKTIEKIKTNKYSEKDLLVLVDANAEILKYLINEKKD